MSAPTFTIKNTFICAVGDENTPPSNPRARAQTVGVAACFGLDTLQENEAESGDESCVAEKEDVTSSLPEVDDESAQEVAPQKGPAPRGAFPVASDLAPAYVVKNTFICAEGVEMSPPSNPSLRARSKTAGAATCFGLDPCHDFDTVADDETCSAMVTHMSTLSPSARRDARVRFATDLSPCATPMMVAHMSTLSPCARREARVRFASDLSPITTPMVTHMSTLSPCAMQEHARACVSFAVSAQTSAAPQQVAAAAAALQQQQQEQQQQPPAGVPASPPDAQGAAQPALVVKNTFICAVDAEEHSPPSKLRARAKTAKIDMFGADTHDIDEELGVEGDVPSSSPEIDLESVEGCQHAEGLIEKGCPQARDALVQALRGHVAEVAQSPQAHRVLEAVVHYMSTAQAAFIAEELSRCEHRVLLDVSVCSVMCRLLEHSPEDPGTVALMDVLLSGGDVASLCSHKNGHAVMAAIASSGLHRQVCFVAAALHSNPQRLARHRFASKVVAAVVRAGSVPQCHSLAFVLMAQPNMVVSLACHTFGVNVVRALLSSPWSSWQVMQCLLSSSQRLQKDKYGRELLGELGAFASVQSKAPSQ